MISHGYVIISYQDPPSPTLDMADKYPTDDVAPATTKPTHDVGDAVGWSRRNSSVSRSLSDWRLAYSISNYSTAKGDGTAGDDRTVPGNSSSKEPHHRALPPPLLLQSAYRTKQTQPRFEDSGSEETRLPPPNPPWILSSWAARTNITQ
jgi:hypothetical protein